MENDKTHRLPQLQGANYAPWYLALRMYAFEIDASDHLSSNPVPPTEAADLRRYESKQNRLLSAVLSSVPMDILGLLLAPEETPTPHDLVQQVISHINQSTKEDHQFLKVEAETITLDNNSIDDYITKHLAVRQKMVAARYPSINDETTTIDFLMAGLKKQPTLTPILAHLLTDSPATIRDFTRKFKTLHNLYQPTTMTATPPTTNQGITGDYGPQPRQNKPRQQYPRAQYPNPRGQYPNHRGQNPTVRIPFHQLCHYHKALGIRCNHTDDQCRDPGHPKYRNPKTDANYMHTQQAIPMMPHDIYHQTHQFHDHCEQPARHDNVYEDRQEAETDNNGTFILDSGAHPTHTTTPAQTMTKIYKPLLTQTATNQQTRCTHIGTMHLRTNKNKTLITRAVTNPNLRHNLLSVKDMAHRYGLVAFTSSCGYIINTRHNPPTVIGKAPWHSNHYAINATIAKPVKSPSAYAARTYAQSRNDRPHKATVQQRMNTTPKPTTHRHQKLPPLPTTTPATQRTIAHLPTLPNTPLTQTPTKAEITAYNWHVRLNHAHPQKLAMTAQQRLIPNMPPHLPNTITITCRACHNAKLHPSPHKRTTHNYPVGAYVSSDTCGPVKPTSTHGNNHMLLIVCAASKFVLAYFIKERKDIPQHIQAAIAHITHRMKHPLQDLRSDNAKEYTSHIMKAIYSKHGLRHHLRTPHQPQENGIAERLNRTIMEAVRALLHTAGIDESYWEDAARDTIFKYNLMHHATIGTSPYQLWYKAKPNIKRIFTFGQLGTIPVYAPKKKLEPRADPARYMYATSLTHIMALNLRTGTYQHTRAEDFHPYNKHTDPTTVTPAAFKTRTEDNKLPPPEIQVHTSPPANLAQARQYPDASEWETAHNAELDNLDAHHSIEWQPSNFQPPPKSVIPLMMLYRYKRSAEGHIIQRKARCNLRGDLMKPGLHYDPNHTTTYTADRTTQRLLIAMHAATSYPLEHFDIKSAYLHEQYQHTRPIYVKQMPRFDGSQKHAGTYGRLVGNLYGSPPAAYYYNHGLQKFLTSLGYQSSEHDPCLYTKHTPHGSTLISTTIDDFLVLATNQKLIDELYHQLLTKYKLKRLGQPTRFLNWTISRTNTGIHLSQPDAVDAILQQTKMHDCNPTLTPYNNMTPLDQQPITTPLTQKEARRYRQILGEIRYITDSTRPDIAYATNRLAQHMSNPQRHHQHALKSLLRYLKGTKTHGLFYPNAKTQHETTHPLQVYSDADFANGKDRKSVTGMVHCYHATPISWNSRKQNVVSLSTTEAEYIAATDATRHTTWLRKLLKDTHTNTKDPTPHHIDNNSAILIASNKAPTKQRKYIDIRHHYLQHHANNATIAVHRTPTQQMLADIFTKPLHRDRFQTLRTALNITPRPEQK